MQSTNSVLGRRPWLAIGMVIGVASGALTGIESAGAQEIKPLKVRMGCYPKTLAWGRACDVFAKRLKELSNGKITVQTLDAVALFPESKGLQAALDGTIDIGQSSTSNYSPFTDAWSATDAPFLFDSDEQFRKVIIRGPIGDAMRAKTAKDGLVPLIIGTFGPRILGTRKPIVTPADIKGLKLRTTESPIPLGFWRATGANPVNVAWGETYMALSTGMVTGVDATFLAWPAGKLWEVTSSISVIPYAIGAGVYSASAKWWNSLDEAQRKVMTAAGREAEDWMMGAGDKEVAELRVLVQKNKVTIMDLTPAQLAEWRAIGRSTWASLPLPQAMLKTLAAEVDKLK